MAEKRKEKKTDGVVEKVTEVASERGEKFEEGARKTKKVAAKKFDEISDKVADATSGLGEKYEEGVEQTKKVAKGIRKWWNKATTEEVVTTIIGIILLICALRELRDFIRGVLLLLFGILCVCGYFDEYLEDLFDSVREKKESNKRK